MNRTIIFILSLFISVATFAQGIEFLHDDFDGALKQAAAEEKLVFVDFYTDWCAPCKMMSRNVFTDAGIGKYYNNNFVAVKANAEKASIALARKYNVHAYPTLLIVNSKGDIVLKKTGAMDVKKFLAFGREAVKNVQSENSLADFATKYASHKQDEDFLLAYVEKLVANKEKAGPVIDEWLQVQQSIKERDVDMMEFLMDYKKEIILGGKAEAVFYANYDEYWDIATRAEEKTLHNMKRNLVSNTYALAKAKNDKAIYELFYQGWKKLPEDLQTEEPVVIRMDYYQFMGQDELFKQTVVHYIDSLISEKSVAEILAEDKAEYDQIVELSEGKYGLGREAKLEKLRVKRAESLNQIIMYRANQLVPLLQSKKEYKKIYTWINFGKSLLPEDFYMYSLEANVLYKQGKTKEALAKKEGALGMINDRTSKYKASLERSLAKMKQGEAILE